MPVLSPSNSPTRQHLVAVTQDMASGRTALNDHPTQSVTTIDGWASTIFGLPFLLAGVFTVVMAFHGTSTQKHAPTWLIAMIGSFFVAAALFLIIHGAAGIARRAAFRRESALHPGQAWLADYAWHQQGFTYSASNEMIKRFLGAVCWTAFVIPFIWIGMTQRGTWMFAVVGFIFLALSLIFWTRWLKMVAEVLRYGNSFLAFDQFPYFLGSSFHARLRAPAHIQNLDQLTFTLRCVQEAYVTSGTGENRSSSVRCFELYQDQTTLTGQQLASYAGGFIPVQFQLPADKPGCNLVSRPPCYWEIEARGTRGNSKGADYQAYFLIPVYPSR
jgi:hypothetical protein